jgi:hypothetical protein
MNHRLSNYLSGISCNVSNYIYCCFFTMQRLRNSPCSLKYIESHRSTQKNVLNHLEGDSYTDANPDVTNNSCHGHLQSVQKCCKYQLFAKLGRIALTNNISTSCSIYTTVYVWPSTRPWNRATKKENDCDGEKKRGE